ncbi:MAG: hypothetical protein MHM6MM_004065 [Cercozoa sp. M6MM]
MPMLNGNSRSRSNAATPRRRQKKRAKTPTAKKNDNKITQFFSSVAPRRLAFSREAHSQSSTVIDVTSQSEIVSDSASRSSRASHSQQLAALRGSSLAARMRRADPNFGRFCQTDTNKDSTVVRPTNSHSTQPAATAEESAEPPRKRQRLLVDSLSQQLSQSSSKVALLEKRNFDLAKRNNEVRKREMKLQRQLNQTRRQAHETEKRLTEQLDEVKAELEKLRAAYEIATTKTTPNFADFHFLAGQQAKVPACITSFRQENNRNSADVSQLFRSLRVMDTQGALALDFSAMKVASSLNELMPQYTESLQRVTTLDLSRSDCSGEHLLSLVIAFPRLRSLSLRQMARRSIQDPPSPNSLLALHNLHYLECLDLRANDGVGARSCDILRQMKSLRIVRLDKCASMSAFLLSRLCFDSPAPHAPIQTVSPIATHSAGAIVVDVDVAKEYRRQLFRQPCADQNAALIVTPEALFAANKSRLQRQIAIWRETGETLPDSCTRSIQTLRQALLPLVRRRFCLIKLAHVVRVALPSNSDSSESDNQSHEDCPLGEPMLRGTVAVIDPAVDQVPALASACTSARVTSALNASFH